MLEDYSIEELQKKIEEKKENIMKEQVKNNEPLGKVLAPFIGKKVLIRANRKGCQVGIVANTDVQFIYLYPSRKLWRWWSKESIALESLAFYGIKEGTRATAICDEDALRLDDICGITTISDAIYNEIMEWPVSEQDK